MGHVNITGWTAGSLGERVLRITRGCTLGDRVLRVTPGLHPWEEGLENNPGLYPWGEGLPRTYPKYIHFVIQSLGIDLVLL